jgi:glycosyltransferase involved in cell wall biosynthesis
VQGLRVVLVGGAPREDPPDYVNRLYALVNELGISERVTFAGPQKPDGVRAAYASAALSINLSPAGLFDKTAFEAMACAVPTLVTNPGFLPVMGDDAPLLLLPSGDDPALIASRLQAVLTIPAAERRALGERLRRAVVAQNSLDVLIPRLVSVINTGELPP